MYAIILAVGEGTRLRPYTNDRPKNMVEVAGKPILEHQILQLKQAGITDIIVSEGYKSETIQNYFGDGSRWGLHISHVQSPPEGGSTGAVKQALKAIPETETSAVLMYGDIISEMDLAELSFVHKLRRRPVTLGLRPHRIPLGVAERNNDTGLVTGFVEKPTLLTNTAICIISRKTYELLPDQGDFFEDLPRLFEDMGFINSYVSEARWWHITDEEDLRRADRELRQILNAEGQLSANKERR